MPRPYQAVLQAVVAEQRVDPTVMGLLFTGSVQQGRPDRNSDLDIFVVTNKTQMWRETRIIDEVEVELFFNTVASMRERISREWKTAAGFATGEILLDRTGEMTAMQALATELHTAGPPPLTAEQINLLRYGLHDRYTDLEDVEMDQVASRLAGGDLVGQALEAFCKLHRYYGDKPKRVAAYVKARDPQLGQMVDDYFARGMHPKHAYEIVNYVLTPVGGRLAIWTSEKITV